MKFRSPTDEPLHIGLTSGHAAVITPEGMELDKIFHREAISRGALPGAAELDTTEQKPAFDRKEVITTAINGMLDGGSEDDFTNDGTPNLRKLTAKVGFQVAREEADAIWDEISKTKA